MSWTVTFLLSSLLSLITKNIIYSRHEKFLFYLRLFKAGTVRGQSFVFVAYRAHYKVFVAFSSSWTRIIVPDITISVTFDFLISYKSGLRTYFCYDEFDNYFEIRKQFIRRNLSNDNSVV